MWGPGTTEAGERAPVLSVPAGVGCLGAQELLSVPDAEGSMLGARARSASDAAVLRRKGHLKEQDMLIEFMLGMHDTHTSAEAMAKMERWIAEHRQVWRRPLPRRRHRCPPGGPLMLGLEHRALDCQATLLQQMSA